MNNISGLQVPGTESYGHSAHSVLATPASEFLREVAQLLETELEEITYAEPAWGGMENAQEKRSQLEGGLQNRYTSSGYDVPHDPGAPARYRG